MPLNLYREIFGDYLNSREFEQQVVQTADLLKPVRRIFFIGNGGSNAICSHMMEDFAKIAGFRTYSFSDAALITCFANDYGYENAMKEWLKVHFDPGDALVAISSSGRSANILNAVDAALEKQGKVITLSGFKEDNPLRAKGKMNFYVGIENYGIVECLHQTILHIVLDAIAKDK